MGKYIVDGKTWKPDTDTEEHDQYAFPHFQTGEIEVLLGEAGIDRTLAHALARSIVGTAVKAAGLVAGFDDDVCACISDPS